MDKPLLGGVANSGSVFRRGDVVVRPSSQYSESIHAYPCALRLNGFDGAPNPRALTDNHEEFDYIEGDVAIPPYPSWAQTDDALASVAELMRRFHDASRVVSPPFLDRDWNDAFGPWPTRGPTICHFDVCLDGNRWTLARRLRVVVDAYGLDNAERLGFVDRLDDSIRRAERFVRVRVVRGEPNFVAMWQSFGGDERFVRRRQWFDEHRQSLHDQLQ
jgi:hypothetical protein